MAYSGAYSRSSRWQHEGRRRRVPYNRDAPFQAQGSSAQRWDQPSYSRYTGQQYDYTGQEYNDAYYDERSSDKYYESYYDSSSQPSAYYNDSYTGPSHAQSFDYQSSYEYPDADSRANLSSHRSYPAHSYDDVDPYAENPFATGYLDDAVERPTKKRKQKHNMTAPIEIEDVSGEVRLRMEHDRQLYISLMQPPADDTDISTLKPAEDSPAVVATDETSAAPAENAAPLEPAVPEAHAANVAETTDVASPVPAKLDVPPPPPPLGPSQEYLKSLDEQTEYSETPRDRKLLILDLNGTLVFRSGPRTAGHHRRVYARPYFEAFRQYILHPKTNIDVMVWSSAQPRNVADMVTKCFGKSYADLIAIWDRTYFDLSKADYNKKSVTIKNLEKPWAFFAQHAATKEHDSTDSNEKDANEAHSTRTTFLLDDSTVKAQLQPYNHLCLREYDEDATRAARGLVLRATANPAPEDTMLAIIGVLEHSRHESNVARWVHDGGLWAGHTPPNATIDNPPPSSSPPPSDDAEAEVVPGNDAAVNPLEPAATQKPQPMWFDHPATFERWVKVGREALERLDIPIERGNPSEPLQLSKVS